MDNKYRMRPITLNLSEVEVTTIRSWYEYASSAALPFGGQPLLFPTEQLLLVKLANHLGGPIVLSRSEVSCIADWMEQSVSLKYGSGRVLFGFEALVYRKIREAMEPGD